MAWKKRDNFRSKRAKDYEKFGESLNDIAARQTHVDDRRTRRLRAREEARIKRKTKN